MINKLRLTACSFIIGIAGFAQQVEFTEYKLENGLDVILPQDTDDEYPYNFQRLKRSKRS